MISVRGGDQRHQRAKNQCELRDALQHNGHSDLSPSTGMLSGQTTRINSRLLAPQVSRLEIDRLAAVLLADPAIGRKFPRAARIPVEPRAAAARPRRGMGGGRSACKLASTLFRCLHIQRGAKNDQDGKSAFHRAR